MATTHRLWCFQYAIEAAFSNKRFFPVLFISFFVLESLLSLKVGSGYDLTVWFNTGVWINEGINIYLPPDHLGYPPLWALWCGLSYKFYLILGSNYTLWTFIIKLPVIIAHLVLAFVVGRFAEKHFEKQISARIFFFVLTWSFFFFIGPIWGQINAISALLTFLAFEAIINKQIGRGALFLGLAVAFKIYPIVTLPAFLVYLLRNKGKRDALKMLLGTSFLAVVFTILIFLLFQWDIFYFVRTVFYTTPVFESNPTQITIGCMNFWSYIGLLNLDLTWQWPFRLIWVPLLGLLGLYWFKRDKVDDAGLTLSLLSFYLVFMATYGWVSEQLFLDLLPFIFLFIFGYRIKRSNLLFLIILQVLIYFFTVCNRTILMFNPWVWAVSPSLGASLNAFYSNNSLLLWEFRGYLGLIISITLIFFLAVLMKPTFLSSFLRIIKKFSKIIVSKLHLNS